MARSRLRRISGARKALLRSLVMVGKVFLNQIIPAEPGRVSGCHWDDVPYFRGQT